MRADSFLAHAPGSSANLGPGFDAVGIALSLHMRARVRPAKRFSLQFAKGAHAPTHDGLAKLMQAAMLRIAALPSAHIEIENEIPLGAGLGSSAAARVLALGIALRASGERIERTLIARIAAELEGHPENALASLYGGVVIAVDAERAIRLPHLHAAYALLILPQISLATSASRALLPDRYSRADAVFTAQHAALLGAALASGSLKHLREAMRDRLHQPYRARSIPGLSEALTYDATGVIGIALSGAGPTLLALLERRADAAQISSALQGCFAKHSVPSSVLRLTFARRGLLLRNA
ncbi:MAG TPA: homoserine kinase [Candidatus Dormibacteraeota bacterium]|nr:homoserine kinase [Candidatus Dormibacteraeota bacterium]